MTGRLLPREMFCPANALVVEAREFDILKTVVFARYLSVSLNKTVAKSLA